MVYREIKTLLYTIDNNEKKGSMKKNLLIILGLIILASTCQVYAKNSASTELTNAIKTYKSGDYSDCYSKLEQILKNEPGNALAYYYMAMTSAQIGRKEEAISNYDKAIALTSANNNLSRYAKKGKRCLETPDKCNETLYDSLDDEFIQNELGPKFSEEVKSDLERLKIENFMREMNRNENIDPKEFKNFKDFSSVPSNDEIVAALRILQRAGLSNMMSNNYADLSVLTGTNQQNSSIMNFMGNSSMNPMLIQALLTNNIQGF